MKKLVCLSLVVFFLLMSSVPGFARHGGGGWGPLVGFGLGVGTWELMHPYYPYNGYYAPPVIVQQAPEVYVQPVPQYAPAPVQVPFYWYYCQDPQGYYPYVNQCPKGWMKVVPTPAVPPQPTVQ